MKPNYEDLFKRLLMLNQSGTYLQGFDGHTWIQDDENSEQTLSLQTVALNNKIYGGVIQALDTIDEALEMDGKQKLIDAWNEHGNYVLRLGDGGIDRSRIDRVPKGSGGIY